MRLIDADKLTQKLTRAAAAAPIIALKKTVEIIMQAVEKEPTAFDLESVLGQIHRATDRDVVQNEFVQGYDAGLQLAENIIKGEVKP